MDELDLLFPSSEGFHDGTDPRCERFIGDEFAGIDTFPFASTQISLLTVNHRILALAEALLAGGDMTCIATTSTTPSWCRARHRAAGSWRCSSS